MEERGTQSPFGEGLSLLVRPPVLVVIAIVTIGAAMNRAAMASAMAGGEAVAFRVGLVSITSGLLGFFIGIACQFYLARRLGSDEPDPAANAAIGKWITVTVIYGLLHGIWSFASPMIAVTLFPDTRLLPFVFIVSGIVLALLLLPLAIRQYAAAHSGDRHRTSVVLAFVRSNALGLFGGLALLSALLAAASWSIVTLLTTLGTYGSALMVGLVGGLSKAVLMVWPLAAYRILNRQRGSDADIFV